MTPPIDIEAFAADVARLPAGPYSVNQYGAGNCGVSAAPEPGDRTGEQLALIHADYRRDRQQARTVAEALARLLTAAGGVAAALTEVGKTAQAVAAEARKLSAQLEILRASDKRLTLFQATRAFKVSDGWHLVNKPEKGLGSFGYTYASLEELQRNWRCVVGARGADPKHGDYVEIIPLDEALAKAGG